MKTELGTAAGIQQWAMDAVDNCGDWRGGQETAEYLAECVRLRQAFDAETKFGQNNDMCTGEDMLNRLRDAMEGAK